MILKTSCYIGSYPENFDFFHEIYRANSLHDAIIALYQNKLIMKNLNILKGQSAEQIIDYIALDLKKNLGLFSDVSAGDLAYILDLCPEQEVWMYEPDFDDPKNELVIATYRLTASDGSIFHMSCRMTPTSEVLEWAGPFDAEIGWGLLPLEIEKAA
jgi:hypothetical protein